ncbi:MAG: sugar phosphate nucleotidyltransferase [Chryseolinea sp.]
MADYNEIVGLVPAGGHATRISPLPCSKELFPVGWRTDENRNLTPKVVSHHLLDSYRLAGVSKTYFILRKGKWDIPQYYGDGAMVGMDLAYLIMNHPHGHPFTLDQAYQFVKNDLVAFGYPDILFQPEEAFSELIRKQNETGASVVLGVFPIREDQKWDLCSFTNDGKIETIALAEPLPAQPRYGWSIAVWTPDFSAFMHDFLADAIAQNSLKAKDGKEYVMNHVFQAALDAKITVEHVMFESGFVRDVGTPNELIAAQMEQAANADKLLKSLTKK